MDLLLRAAENFKTILETTGREIVFKNSQGEELFTVKGRVNRIEGVINPQTNVQVYLPIFAISISNLSLPPEHRSIILNENTPKETLEDSYVLRTTDSDGSIVKGVIVEKPRVDFSLAFANYLVQSFTEVIEPDAP